MPDLCPKAPDGGTHHWVPRRTQPPVGTVAAGTAGHQHVCRWCGITQAAQRRDEELGLTSTDMAPTPCFQCGYVLDAATDPAQTKQPKPGDVSLCMYCGAIGIYLRPPLGGALTVRPATGQERDQIRAQPNIRQILALRSRMMGRPKD